jgi:hypothetical protein
MIKGMKGSKMTRLLINNGTVYLFLLVISLCLPNGSMKAAQSGSPVNIVISSNGCSPSTATQPAGRITFHVTNQTEQAELSIQLYGSRGELIREVNLAQGTTEWSETFDLAAGSYTIVAGHKSEWLCRITVQ